MRCPIPSCDGLDHLGLCHKCPHDGDASLRDLPWEKHPCSFCGRGDGEETPSCDSREQGHGRVYSSDYVPPRFVASPGDAGTAGASMPGQGAGAVPASPVAAAVPDAAAQTDSGADAAPSEDEGTGDASFVVSSVAHAVIRALLWLDPKEVVSLLLSLRPQKTGQPKSLADIKAETDRLFGENLTLAGVDNRIKKAYEKLSGARLDPDEPGTSTGQARRRYRKWLLG